MRKVRLWLALVATLLATSAGAQSNLTVTAAEYFFDSDPGYGQATVINNVRGDELEIAIPTSNLSVGAHMLCLRTLGSNGVWSTTMTKPIFVMSTGSEVARVEYFFDNDPGYGKGSVLATSGSPDVTIEISTGNITPGAHMLYLRSQDANGNWSPVMAHPIYVFTVLPVAALEYYIDESDPGEGKAISVPVATATAATATFDIETSTLTPGEHTLNVRAMGIDSVWTAVSTRRFMVEGAAEPEPYAVLTENTATDGTVSPAPNRAATEKQYTLTFYYDDKKADRNGMSVGPFTSESQRGWSGVNRITDVMFDDSFAEYTELTSTAYWFFDLISLKSITGIKNLKTDKVTDMSNMFFRCSQLEEIDLSTLNTSNATNMAYMFAYTGLTSLDVSLFNTSKVTDMSGMFIGSILTTLDLTSFNTEKVTTMNSMFMNSYNFASIDISSFKTSSLTNADFMFNNCTVLTTIFASEEWNTEKITEGSQMFRYSTKLVGGKGTTYDENHTDYTYAHIDGGTTNPGYFTDKNATTTNFIAHITVRGEGEVSSGLITVRDSGEVEIEPGSPFQMFFYPDSAYYLGSLIVNGDDMTQGVSPATASGAASFTMQNVTSDLDIIVEFMPESPVVTEPEPYVVLSQNADVISIDEETGEVDYGSTLTFYYDDQRSARQGMPMGEGGSPTWGNYAAGITSVVFDPSFANYTTITTTNRWFMGFNKLTSITGLEYLNTENVTSMSEMFYECSSLTSLDLRTFKTQNVTDMSMMFQYCYNLAELNLSSFNTSNVTSFFQMFLACGNLKNLDITHFNTANVRSMRWMFGRCSGLQHIDLSHFDTWNVQDMGEMFYNDYGLTSLDLSNFNTENLTNMWCMFKGCSGLTTLDISNFNTDKVTHMQELFQNCTSLQHINMNSFNTAKVEEFHDMFDNCTSLASIQAGSAAIPDSIYAQIGNPNLLVYVNNESLAPSNITNVVVNGFAKNIVLTDAKEGNNNWFCPQTFTAEMVNYTREFRQETTVGVSRGWEAIALPFDVQNITHEKWGAIAPFNNTQSSKHFWLRQLGENGLFSATRIEANVPYVISMPNDAVNYPEEFLLAGRVTFSAENVTIPATEPRIMSLADSSIVMMPAFLRVDRSPDVWAINIGEVRGQYYEGSVFEREYRVVRPFEAYTVHRGNSPAPRFVPINSMISETTGIEEVENAALNAESYYDLNGRKLQGKPKTKGVYITNGRKVVIR